MQISIKDGFNSRLKHAAHVVAVPGETHVDESFIRLDELFAQSGRVQRAASITIPNLQLVSTMPLLMWEMKSAADARLKIELRLGLTGALSDKRWIELMQHTNSCGLFLSIVSNCLMTGEDLTFIFESTLKPVKETQSCLIP